MISEECLNVWVWSGVLAELMLPVQTGKRKKTNHG